MVQKYSSVEISREQYTPGFKYQARTELWDYHLIFMYIFAIYTFKIALIFYK
jgi:hypothetical protein